MSRAIKTMRNPDLDSSRDILRAEGQVSDFSRGETPRDCPARFAVAGVTLSFPSVIVHARKQQRRDLLRRPRRQRSLGERKGDGAQAEDAIQLERIGRAFRES